MDQTEKISFKERLLQQCVSIIESRIQASIVLMEEAQAAANNEEKSSAGDKYETGRAMNQLDKDMHARQLTGNRQELVALKAVDHKRLYDSVMAGAFIQTQQGNFFIAAGLGKIRFEGMDIFLLSPNAPLARSFFGKKKHDDLIFAGKQMQIDELF